MNGNYIVKVTFQDGTEGKRTFANKANAEEFFDSLRTSKRNNICVIRYATLYINGIDMCSLCHLNRKQCKEYLRDIMGDITKYQGTEKRPELFSFEDAHEANPHWTKEMWDYLLEAWLGYDLVCTQYDNEGIRTVAPMERG